MFLRFKPTSHKKSPRLCKQSSRRTKKRGLIAGPHKILMRICSIFRRTTTPAEWTIFTARRRRQSHFLSKLSSWTRTLLWRMQIFQSRRVGCITAPTPCQRGVRKRVSTRTKRCDCNRTCRKGVSHSDSLTINGDRDYERALAEFETARRGLPNEAQAYLAIGSIQRRQGKWDESNANLEKAAALDPKNISILVNLGFSYIALRNFAAADKIIDRAIAMQPNSFETVGLKAMSVAMRGDLELAEKQLSSVGETDSNGVITYMRFWVLILQRRFSEARAIAQKFSGQALRTESTAPAPKSWLTGTAHFLQGDKETAQTEFAQALVVSEKLLNEAPQDPARHAQHGLILAALGRKEEAIAEGKRAVELLPESQDAFDGPQATATLAKIYAWTGEFDEAFRLLDHLVKIPNGVAVPILKLDPEWDPLRKDPRFQALIEKYAAKG